MEKIKKKYTPTTKQEQQKRKSTVTAARGILRKCNARGDNDKTS